MQAPAQLPQHPPDVAGMVAHAGQPLDHLRDALQGPPVGRKAVRTSALAQGLVDDGALFGRQLWPAALAASTGQCGGAACLQAGVPDAGCLAGNLQRAGDLGLRGAMVEQLGCAQATLPHARKVAAPVADLQGASLVLTG